MIENLPEVIVVGDIEMLFLGGALALGFPRVTRRILDQRYGRSGACDEGGQGDE